MICQSIKRRSVSLFLFLLQKNERKLSSMEIAQLLPKEVVNDKVRSECLKRLQSTSLPQKIDSGIDEAAVLVPLCIHNEKLGLLYTLRSHKVSSNKGQVSFAGGMSDKNDGSLEETALRETWEELHIPKKKIEVWGTTGKWIQRKKIKIMPVLAFVGEIDPENLEINRNEVQEAFVHPLEKLCNPELCRYTQFRAGYTLPVYLGGSHKIWGLTAVITHIIMSALVPSVYKHNLTNLKPILV